MDIIVRYDSFEKVIEFAEVLIDGSSNNEKYHIETFEDTTVTPAQKKVRIKVVDDINTNGSYVLEMSHQEAREFTNLFNKFVISLQG